MKKNNLTTFAKENLIHLKTSRLILRQWKPDDYAPFSEMNSDPDVMQYFPLLFSARKVMSFLKK